MRSWRLCSTLPSTLGSWLGSLLGSMLVACAGGRSAPPPPDAALPTTAPSTERLVPSATALPASPSVEPEDPELVVQRAANAARQCATPKSTITSFPAEGKVFNNALTRKDAGNVDRMQGILDAVFAASKELACCLDAGWTEGETSSVVVMTTWTVSAEGQTSSFAIDHERSDLDHPVMARCLANAVNDLEFPESPSGKTTSVELPLRAERPEPP